jgi:hypothetical protein
MQVGESILARIYGKRFDGKVFEIQNWGQRKASDALVMQPLSNSQTQTLKSLRAKGRSDSQIWHQLHPGQPRPDRPLPVVKKTSEFKVEIEALGKDQLVWLLESMMGTSLKTTARMNREDLIKLALHVSGSKELRISFGG